MKLKLLEKIDGYEEVAEYRYVRSGEIYINGDVPFEWGAIESSCSMLLVLTPERKVVDWGKCDDKLLLVRDCGLAIARLSSFDSGMINSLWTVDKEWQAHTLGDKCPVDPDAFRVGVRYKPGGNIYTSTARTVDWSSVTQYKVTGLADGYEYK